MFESVCLFAGRAGKCICTYPGPVKWITRSVLRLIVLLADSVDLDAAFLSADQGCSGAYGLLLLNNASATGEQYRYRQAKNHIFHSGYIPGRS